MNEILSILQRCFIAVSVASIIAGGASSSDALAGNLNVFAGSNLGSSERGLLVAEYTLPFIALLGPFAEWSRSMASGPENRYTAGLVGRMTLPFLNFFVDTRAGYDWTSSAENLMTSTSGFDLEFGLGYRFTFTTVDLLPRFGLHAVTGNSDIPATNLTLGVAITL